MEFRLHHRDVTGSTNLDALAGAPGDVFTAAWQTAGRGRLDHKWHSAAGANLIMSVVFAVDGLAPERVATFPLAVGLAVARALDGARLAAALKWPNDVYVGGRKICGILCERHDDRVIAGVGVNVGQRGFPSEIAARATSLALEGCAWTVEETRDRVLAALGEVHAVWAERGFAALWPEWSRRDWLRGRRLAVKQTDDDSAPVEGDCGGVQPDGTLRVGDVSVYAGEAHVVL